jgi:small-conductance mechanosensitive channel
MFEDSTLSLAASVAMLAAGVVAGLLVHEAVFRLLSRFTTGAEGAAVRHARRPTRVLLALISLLLVVPLADIPSSLGEVVSRSIGLAIIGVFGWLAIAMLNVAEDVAAERYPITVRDNFGARALQTRMRVLRSAGVVVITVITVSVILMSFPSVRQLGVSLLASAGLLALIVGMAARPALENLIAGLQIALTQPIKLDDVVVIEGEWGRIEEITATYVVVRIWDSRRLLVPLGYFISHPVENWTRQTSDILGTVTMQVDYRVPVEEMRSELHTILQETPLWDQRVWNLQVTDTSQNGVELRALMSAVDSGTAWELRCHVREGLLRVVNDRWPQSLPRLRAEIEPQAGAGNGSQPQPAL